MEQMNALCGILQECVKEYESLLEIEHKKYDAAIKNDIASLNQVIAMEQVFCLKIKGLEQKRLKIMQDMNLKDKTFKETMENAVDDQKLKLEGVYDRLSKVLLDVKKINKHCKVVIDVRLHRLSVIRNRIEEREKIYINREGNKDNLKSLILSKRI
jgi:hypothetical protein